MTTHHARRATVLSPATSANLGPGFDAFGLALGSYDVVTAEVIDGGVEVEVVGEGSLHVPLDESHLVVRSMRATFERLGATQPGLRLHCDNAVPLGRGLGSSSSAIVSGIRLAEALVPETLGLGDVGALALATELEGHPDNVAACLFGGFTIAWSSPAGARVVRLDVHPAVVPTVFVPPHALSTEVARGLLPAEVSHLDASANSARAALLVAALTERPDLLLDATDDRLHQAYRAAAMPESAALVADLRGAGHAAVVSGAGPSVLVLSTGDNPLDNAAWTPAGWRAARLPLDPQGARVTVESPRSQ
jgi:homoserine kinase